MSGVHTTDSPMVGTVVAPLRPFWSLFTHSVFPSEYALLGPEVFGDFSWTLAPPQCRAWGVYVNPEPRIHWYFYEHKNHRVGQSLRCHLDSELREDRAEAATSPEVAARLAPPPGPFCPAQSLTSSSWEHIPNRPCAPGQGPLWEQPAEDKDPPHDALPLI